MKDMTFKKSDLAGIVPGFIVFGSVIFVMIVNFL